MKAQSYADNFVPSTTEPKHPSNDAAVMAKEGEPEPLWPYKGIILKKEYHWRGKQTQGGEWFSFVWVSKPLSRFGKVGDGFYSNSYR